MLKVNGNNVTIAKDMLNCKKSRGSKNILLWQFKSRLTGNFNGRKFRWQWDGSDAQLKFSMNWATFRRGTIEQWQEECAVANNDVIDDAGTTSALSLASSINITMLKPNNPKKISTKIPGMSFDIVLIFSYLLEWNFF